MNPCLLAFCRYTHPNATTKPISARPHSVRWSGGNGGGVLLLILRVWSGRAMAGVSGAIEARWWWWLWRWTVWVVKPTSCQKAQLNQLKLQKATNAFLLWVVKILSPFAIWCCLASGAEGSNAQTLGQTNSSQFCWHTTCSRVVSLVDKFTLTQTESIQLIHQMLF